MPTPFDFVNPNQPILDRSAVPAPINTPVAVAPPVPTQNPATAPAAADTEGRKSRWKSFLERLNTDPVVQQQLLQAGITMIKGQRTNEGFNSLVGRAAQSSALSGQFLRRNQLQADQAQQKIDLEAERNATNRNLAEVQGRSATENIASSQQTRRQGAAKFPLEQRKITAETEAQELTTKNAPALQEADIALKESEAKQRKAQAELFDRTTPPVDETAAILKNIKLANPGASAAANAQAFLDRLNLKTEVALEKVYGTMALNPFVEPEDQEVFKAYLRESVQLRTEARRGKKSRTPAPKKSAWETARDSVSVGEDYVGPDGKTYTRGQ